MRDCYGLSFSGLWFFSAAVAIITFAVIIVVAVVIIVKLKSKNKGDNSAGNDYIFKPQPYSGVKTASGAKPAEPQKPKADAAQVAQIEERLKALCKNSVRLEIGGETAYKLGGTRFGGKPDVPRGFEWPYFETDSFDDKEVKPRPLAFLAQFDLEVISEFDTEGLLPRSGTLAFFYEIDSQRWGFDPKDGGCARVYWFHEWEDLSPAEFPEDLKEMFRSPMLNIAVKSEKSYPDSEDFYLTRTDWNETIDAFETACSNLGIEEAENRSKLLGWADVIQGNMTSECEEIARGFSSDEVWNGGNFPKDQLKDIEAHGDDWTLLLQLDTVENGDFELMFGDCGRIYFYIRKEDLKLKRFDRVWLILQCF